MEYRIGTLVTRKSHNHDTIFKIEQIRGNEVILKGVNMRLYADADISDISEYKETEETAKREDITFIDKIKNFFSRDRSEYFYLPGKVLHIDGDRDYLERCLKFYKESNILAYGIYSKESELPKNIRKYLEDINPDILVITGHEAYYKKQDINNLNSYKNSYNFVNSVKEARKYEKSHEKLIIIAGACQSDYEELIRAGANFASSPKRINIHALDPAIVASSIGLSDRSDDIDLLGILEKTKYGKDGIGGIKTKGTMYIGYPR